MEVRNQQVETNVRQVGEWVTNIDDPHRQAAAAQWAMKELNDQYLALAEVRRGAVRKLWIAGWTYRQIAHELGMTPARVDQLINR